MATPPDTRAASASSEKVNEFDDFRLSQSRHPELVSGSIVPHARRSHQSTALGEKWILKQVQDDDPIKMQLAL
jgi:hypothetical protein